MSITLSVLTPFGRRQTVKVSPNSTILQILEDVCTKQNLDASAYDLRHHSRILDSSSVVRFSQLPNNALLEMVSAKKKREESPVNIMLQLESGERLNGDFQPSSTLKDVLITLCPTKVDSIENPVIIYMRKEIFGLDELSKTTLKELGLTSGRALLRFLHRSKELLGQQLNVSNPLVKPTKIDIELPTTSNCDSKIVSPETCASTSTSEPEKMAVEPTKSIKTESSETLCSLASNSQTKESESRQSLKRVLGEDMKNNCGGSGYNQTSYDSVPYEKKPCKSYELEEPEIDVSQTEFLGDREALLFHLSDHKSSKIKDDTLPEEFFDLTLEDARSIMRDYKRVREEIENAALTTQGMKDLSISQQVLSHLNKYQQTVIRIQFPNRYVFQGIFRPLETIQHIIDFVKPYLKNPNSPFYLYTVPPKTMLNPSQTLVEANCVPAAVVYFGSEESSNQFIDEKFVLKTVQPNVAAHFANKSRKSRNNCSKSELNSITEFVTQNDSEMECLPGPSNENGSSTKPTAVYDQTKGTTKSSSAVPKWFKPV